MHKAGLSKQAFSLLFAAKVDDPPDRGSIPIEPSYTIAFSSKLASEFIKQRRFHEPLLEAAAFFFVCVTNAAKRRFASTDCAIIVECCSTPGMRPIFSGARSGNSQQTQRVGDNKE